MSSPHAARALFDFSVPGAALGWRTVDDVVMGGRSSSRFRPTSDGTACFEGTLSLEQGGGFSLAKKPVALDLSPYRGVALHVRGDGKRYHLNLYNEATPNAVSYRAAFHCEPDVWRTLFVSFDALVPTSRGRRVPEASAFDPADVRAFGLLISDQQAGPFCLELAWIKAVLHLKGSAGP